MQVRMRFWTMSILVFGWSAAASGDDSPVGWRHDGSGCYPEARPPTAWSGEQNVLWKTALPGRSISSPVVVGRNVFTTAEPGELLCLNAANGKILWERSHSYQEALGAEQAARIEADHRRAEALRKQVEELNRERQERKKTTDSANPTVKKLQEQIESLEKQIETLRAYPPLPGGDTGNTACTPTSDGRQIFAVFGTGIVSAHSLKGERRWMKFIAAPNSNHSASPLLVDGRLIVQLRDLRALDPATGDVVWQTPVSERNGSPVAARLTDGSVIITPGGAIVRAVDGRLLAKEQFQLSYCSPIVNDGVIYAVQEGTVKALRLPASTQEPFALSLLWETKGSRTHRLASPLIHDGLLYAATEKGILEAYVAKTGEEVYQQRLGFGRGRVDPSLCLAGGMLFASGNDGLTIVVQPGREFAELARNTLEDFTSTPSFHDTRVFIRTKQAMFCLGESQ